MNRHAMISRSLFALPLFLLSFTALDLSSVGLPFLGSNQAYAINITLDYSYDSNGFFNQSTTQGQQARATLEAAADFYSEILTDTFSSISTPNPYVGEVGTLTWTWSTVFTHPASGSSVSIVDPTIPADEYRIYAGARNHSGNTLGVGGGGGMSFSSSTSGAGFYPEEISEIETISNQFLDDIQTRGEISGFSNWGGALSFDNNTSWNYDHTSNPTGGQSDLYSVAIHELGHTLGLGTSDEWHDLVSTSNRFTGINAQNANGGSLPYIDSGGGHWLEGTESRIYGGTDTQEAAMDPTVTTGTRKYLTLLDAAGLADIGWSVVEPEIAGLLGDYNGDGTVDAADYTVYRDSLGSTTLLAADGSGNGQIDAADYNVWVSAYGNSNSTTTSTAVPEPNSAVLAIFSLMLGATFGRSR